MARNSSASLAAALVLAAAPLALHAQLVIAGASAPVMISSQQDAPQSETPANAQVGIELQSDPQWQATLTSPSDASDPGVSSQWETSMPAQPDITVINVKAPPKTDNKADKVKAAAAAALQAKKKLAPVKPKSVPVGTPGSKEQSQTQGQAQNWETEFLVDHLPDHQPDRATPKAEQ